MDFNEINKQYEELFGRKKLLGEEEDEEVENSGDTSDQQGFL